MKGSGGQSEDEKCLKCPYERFKGTKQLRKTVKCLYEMVLVNKMVLKNVESVFIKGL